MKLTKANGQQAEVRNPEPPSNATLHLIRPAGSRTSAWQSSPERRREEWWEAVPVEERQLLCCVMRAIRAAKRSELPKMARAAIKWDLTLSCFIKVRLMGQNRKAEIRKLKLVRTADRMSAARYVDGVTFRVTSSPSTSQSRSDVSPRQG